MFKPSRWQILILVLSCVIGEGDSPPTKIERAGEPKEVLELVSQWRRIKERDRVLYREVFLPQGKTRTRFLWLQMCFQSLHRPTPQKIKELVRWPVSWPRGCFTCMVYQHVFILIKAEILKESCLNTCATFMACRRVDLQLIIQRGMANVSVSITHYMICFIHCQKIRTKSGLSFYRSYFLHTTPLLIDQRVTLLMS